MAMQVEAGCEIQKGAPAGREGGPAPVLPPVFSVRQAAAYLGVSAWTVYEYCRQGAIPHRRVGRRILIGREALRRWLEEGAEREDAAPRPAPPQAAGSLERRGGGRR